MKSVTSSNLAWAVRQDQSGAMEELVRAYQDRLFGYALRLVKDAFDAREITQDAFLRAYQCLAFEYDDDKCRQLQLTPWLFRVTRNLALNRLRSRRRFPTVVEDTEASLDELEAGSAADPRARLEVIENRSSLEKALARLAGDARDVVALRFVEGMSYVEIVAVTGGSEASVRGKVFRALKKLRVILSEE